MFEEAGKSFQRADCPGAASGFVSEVKQSYYLYLYIQYDLDFEF